jgi:hypothetical protein
VDDAAEAGQFDAEDARGLVCGEVAGPDVLRLHGSMMPAVSEAVVDAREAAPGPS